MLAAITGSYLPGCWLYLRSAGRSVVQQHAPSLCSTEPTAVHAGEEGIVEEGEEQEQQQQQEEAPAKQEQQVRGAGDQERQANASGRAAVQDG